MSTYFGHFENSIVKLNVNEYRNTPNTNLTICKANNFTSLTPSTDWWFQDGVNDVAHQSKLSMHRNGIVPCSLYLIFIKKDIVNVTNIVTNQRIQISNQPLA